MFLIESCGVAAFSATVPVLDSLSAGSDLLGLNHVPTFRLHPSDLEKILSLRVLHSSQKLW